MKKITIKQIHFVNFKGFADKTIEFKDGVTTIYGPNASGKTSVFDGFTWLLFGKDSQDRKTFDIKTLGEDGKPIPRIPHEVSAIITVDGEEIRLCRRFNEKWVKRIGQAQEEFKGHEEERLYNDVPMSLKEWNDKIAGICSEQVFKFITNPFYFSSQKTEVQREMLFRMAGGDISAQDIAGDNKDFNDLLASLTGKTMDEYKREIQANKRRIKAEIEAIPDRIDERNRDIAALSEIDFMSTVQQLHELEQEKAQIEAELLDISKQQQEISNKRAGIVMEIGNLKEQKARLESDIRINVTQKYRDAIQKKSNIESKIRQLNTIAANIRASIEDYKKDLSRYNDKRTALLAEWKEISSMQLTFNESDFVCPTCGRSYDIEEIEGKQQEMTEKFNQKKAELLQDNNRKGKANKKLIDDTTAAISNSEKQLEDKMKQIDELKEAPESSFNGEEPDAQPVIESDPFLQQLNKDISAKEAQLEKMGTASDIDTAERRSRIKDIEAQIKECNTTLDKKGTIERNNQRIAELEQQKQTGEQEVAELERIEFTIADFNKARVEATTSKINAMFSMVSFKMFDTQINGEEVETCEAMNNGVPFSSQNFAMRINMGLDIINAICKAEGISAPIFIDNAESVTSLIDTESQMIRLVVSSGEFTKELEVR